MERVCQGKRFVGAGLERHVAVEFADGQVPKRVHSDEFLGSPPEAAV